MKYLDLLFFIFFGFILKPSDIYACNFQSEEIEITRNLSGKTSLPKNDCCENEPCGKSEKDCDGKCKNSACQCPTNCINCIVSLVAQISYGKVVLSNSIFYYKETFYSSKFFSVWLPPKIG